MYFIIVVCQTINPKKSFPFNINGARVECNNVGKSNIIFTTETETETNLQGRQLIVKRRQSSRKMTYIEDYLTGRWHELNSWK